MKKELLEKAIQERLDQNFDNYSKYFETELNVFLEFRTMIYEITDCLILEFNIAAITLTNHLLERLLKLSLIYNEAGIGYLPIENWESVFSEPNKKYSSIGLGNSIEKCKKNGLITESEKVLLFDTIRNIMRNGFSHADPSKVLEKLLDNSTVIKVNINNPEDLKTIQVNQNIIPDFQSYLMAKFAKENASPYFEFVLKLMKNIEIRLQNNK